MTILEEGAQILDAPDQRRIIMAGKTAYKNTWQRENVDRVNLTMPKGRKAIIQAHAEAHSESVNGFINRAILEAMERDGAAPVASEGE